MEALYDSHATKQSLSVAIPSRNESNALPLKEFHNAIKRALFLQFCREATRLMDIGCGRGGDISKWLEAKLFFVRGIDLSPASIQECRERFWNYTRKTPAVTQTLFAATNLFGTAPFKDDHLYDNVSCMFALHYFFESEAILHQMLHNVSDNLKPGGVFFGCVPHGVRILAALNQTQELQNDYVLLKKHFKGEPSCFGSKYMCAIKDTVTSQTEEKTSIEGSMEYLVFENVLVQVAAKFDLEPIYDYGPFSSCSDKPHLRQYKNWTDFFDADDTDSVFKHFHLRFEDPNLVLTSSLFCAFAFRKKKVI